MLTNESDPMMELCFLEKDHWFQRQLLLDFGRETSVFFLPMAKCMKLMIKFYMIERKNQTSKTTKSLYL